MTLEKFKEKMKKELENKTVYHHKFLTEQVQKCPYYKEHRYEYGYYRVRCGRGRKWTWESIKRCKRCKYLPMLVNFREYENKDLVFLDKHLFCTIEYDEGFGTESARIKMRNIFENSIFQLE